MRSALGVLSCALIANPLHAAPVTASWPVSGTGVTAGVAAAAYAGAYAAGDTFDDSVEIRNVRGAVAATISRSQILALVPWMSFDNGPDGPGTLCFSASGRVLYVLVHDDTLPGDGLGSDAILRYDVSTGSLTLAARLDAFDRGDIAPHLAMAHHKGALFVGTHSAGIRVYLAAATGSTSTLLSTWALPAGGPVRGLAIDRDAGTLWACSDSAVYRTTIPAVLSTTPTWVQIATGTDLRALTWAEHYGPSAARGLYLLSGVGPGAKIDAIPFASAYSTSIVTPTPYLTTPGALNDLCATADGGLFAGADQDALLVRDDADTRLSFDQWLASEFAQVLAFSRGLISPDGEPPGWVIDADTDTATPRFHPATPDGAAWTVLMLLMSDRLNADAQAPAQVRSILTRYAGLAPDGIKPSRTADGIFRHWIDPLTGQAKSGWDPEFATLSTMKMVAAAARAMAYYPDDPVVARAASRIIFLTRNWDNYFGTVSPYALAFKGALGGGPDFASFSSPFHEGVIFADQAGTYGPTRGPLARAAWLNRAALPSATFVPGMPITSTANGLFESAFISLYPALLIPAYRSNTSWQAQVSSIRWSNAAWTDDNGPRFMTVFSAGTTRSDWGGYRADSLGNHPGNVTTFTSLMAMSALGDPSPAVSAYHAYRKGARQTFRTGASILYRRSDVDRSYLPNSAGLPDVALGALGLAELIQPGSVDGVLAGSYPRTELCPVDLNADGVIDEDDLYRAAQAPSDLNGDGVINAADSACLRAWLRRNEARSITGR